MAFLANHAEFHDGLVFVSGGFPEWWNTPAWGQLQQLSMVIIARIDRADIGVQYRFEVVFQRPDGSESPLLQIAAPGRALHPGDPEMPSYYHPIGFGFAVEFRQEGLHHFLVRRGDEQVFDVPLYVRLAPLPTPPAHSAVAAIVVERATYGSGLDVKDVTQIIRDAVRPGGLTILASNETFGGDPAPNVVKHLVVSYHLPDSSKTEVVDVQEGQELVLP